MAAFQRPCIPLPPEISPAHRGLEQLGGRTTATAAHLRRQRAVDHLLNTDVQLAIGAGGRGNLRRRIVRDVHDRRRATPGWRNNGRNTRANKAAPA